MRERHLNSKFTPARVASIIGSMAQGNFYATACRAASIHPDTGHEWRQRAAEHEAVCVETEETRAAVEQVIEARDDAGTAIVAYMEEPPVLCDSDEHDFLVYAYALARAEALAEALAVRTLGASPDWRAHAFLLERRHATSGWAAKVPETQVSVTVNVDPADVRKELAERLDRISLARTTHPDPATVTRPN